MLVLSWVAIPEAHPSPRCLCGVGCWENGASARFHLDAQIYLLGIAYTWTPTEDLKSVISLLNRDNHRLLPCSGSRTTYPSTNVL